MQRGKPRTGEAFRSLLERLDEEDGADTQPPPPPRRETHSTAEPPRPSPPCLPFPEAPPRDLPPEPAAAIEPETPHYGKRLQTAPRQRSVLPLASVGGVLALAGGGLLAWLLMGEPESARQAASLARAETPAAPAKPPSVAPAPVRILETRPVPAEPRAVSRFAAPRSSAAPAEEPARRPAGEAAALIERGRAAAANGDLTAARLFYQRAAEAASGEGAMLLAETYDPNVLARLGAVGLAADAEKARHWYERAMQLGVRDAAGRIAALGRR